MSLTIAQAEDFWKGADKNNDGVLTCQELQKAMKQYCKGITDAEVAGVFVGLNQNADEFVTKKEFLNEMVEKNKRRDDLKKMWRKYDKDNNGELSRAEVIEIIKDHFPPEEKNRIVGEFLCHCDWDKSGNISEKEFMKFFCA